MKNFFNPMLSSLAVPRRLLALLAVSVFFFAAFPLHAQSASPASAAAPIQLDHVVAVVGDQAILQSDVEEEMRFTALQSAVLPASENTPPHALHRLIDRALIDKERLLQPSFSTVPDVQVETGIDELKKTIPACAHHACESYVEWDHFLESQGFTLQQAHDRMLQRLQILKFIDWRFGSAVRIHRTEIAAYYQTVLLPQFAHSTVPPPPLPRVSHRIREILQQQRITGLMDDWLKNLRAEGQVHIVDPAYASVGASDDASDPVNSIVDGDEAAPASKINSGGSSGKPHDKIKNDSSAESGSTAGDDDGATDETGSVVGETGRLGNIDGTTSLGGQF